MKRAAAHVDTIRKVGAGKCSFVAMWLPLVVAGLAVISQTVLYDWKLDDAYITFSYARNWVDGHGIVFNVGEEVRSIGNEIRR